MGTLSRKELALCIDHTLLAPEATTEAIEALCTEGLSLGVGAVCVSPSMVLTAVAALPRGFVVASVIGFPSGAHVASIKAQEAERACADGAREIDMVVNLAAVAQAQWQTVANEVAQVRREIGNNVVLKVIVESALWSDAQVISTCTAAVDGGADFVKTSTGFHTSGGATARVVRIMRGTVGTDLGVKASGGIRSLATTLEMLEAGANRIGTSSARIILDEAEQKFGIDKQ